MRDRAVRGPDLDDDRAGSTVRRDDLERRLPRSAPDALRFEPGVFVQQTAHGQGSAFVRGLTGQQTVLLFDGIRLNNATYRQGPNQYFFTLDARTLESIEVLRGGGSTEWGSDALGGVVLAHPLTAPLDAPEAGLWPRFTARVGSADDERGGRIELPWSLPGVIAFRGGVGGRRVGLLESAGPVDGLDSGEPALVPRYKEDGRTQLGTGFDELTFDARLTGALAEGHTLTAALYGYRQYDAPRTDQCPPAYAPSDECLIYLEQFRTLAYLAYESAPGPLETLRATLSLQRQHEKRESNRPRSFVRTTGRDDVETIGASLRAESEPLPLHGPLSLVTRAGAELYHDDVSSKAWLQFTDVELTLERSRGQYLDGSAYLYGGAFGLLELSWDELATVRGGGRVSHVAADAPGDDASGSAGISQDWSPLVGFAGLTVRPLRPLSLLVTWDASFRAPNLDDLTSRQQTGPGFQFENAELRPERARTLEAGARWKDGRVEAEAWLFRTNLFDTMVREPREAADCPPGTPACSGSWSRFQLVNSDRGGSTLEGLELALRLRLPAHLWLRGTLAYAEGWGPNPQAPPADPTLPYEASLPLSRVPPLNGTAELDHRNPRGFALGAALRWARAQDRLALQDFSDARIPGGGTPGWAVVDLRGSYRHGDALALSVVLENLLDEPWRAHGSAIEGPGRSVVLELQLAPASIKGGET